MMWQEFETLAGYRVSYEDYTKIIEPMYMALEVTKQEFVKMLDKKRFALPTEKELITKMKKLARFCKANCGHSSCFSQEEDLYNLAREYVENFLGGMTENTYLCFNRGYEFPDIDRGCTYPQELVIMRGEFDLARIWLV